MRTLLPAPCTPCTPCNITRRTLGSSPGGVSDELYATAREEFNEKELVDLTMAIVTINGWNRLAIALGADVGSYQPRREDAASATGGAPEQQR